MKIGSRGEFLEHYILLPPTTFSDSRGFFLLNTDLTVTLYLSQSVDVLYSFFYFDSIDTLFCFSVFVFVSFFRFLLFYSFPVPCVPFFQVAIIAGNFELAELIKNHKETDIGKRQRHIFSFLFYPPGLSPHPPESFRGSVSNPPPVA